jgi:hypothetical protein
MADSYIERVNAGQDPWKWKALDPLEEQLMQAKIDGTKAKTAKTKASGGGGGQTILNQTAPMIQRMRKNGGGISKMSPDAISFWTNAQKINFDAKTNTYRPSKTMGGYDKLNPTEKLNLTNAMSVNFKDYVVQLNPETGQQEAYMLADVIYDADNAIPGNPHEETFGINSYSDKQKFKNNWTFMDENQANVSGASSGEVVKGEALISIEDETQNSLYMDDLNTFINNRSNLEGATASVNNEGYARQMEQDAINLTKRFPNITLDEAYQHLNYINQSNNQKR